MPLPELPEVIFYLLQGYLSSNEFRNIFNCSKYDETMIRLKKKLCVFHLNEYYSSLYFSSDGDFKSKLLSIIEDPRKQLGINLSEPGTVYDLFVDDEDSDQLPQPVLKLSQFRDIHSLKLDSHAEWNEVMELQDLSLFASIEYLQLSCCTSMVKLQGLISIRELTISEFPELSDISPLSNCLHLTKVVFVDCDVLEDINALAHVPDIELSNCVITDEGIAQLGQSLKRFKAYEIHQISNIDHLTSLEILSLESCYNIRSINGLSNLKHLHLMSCPYIKSYSNSPSLQTIKIEQCSHLLMDYSESFPLKAFSYRKEHAAITGKLIEQQINLLSMKECWKSIAIVRLHFHMPTELFSSINILAEINSLRKLDLYHIIDKSLDIHLFQQIVWLSVHEVPDFSGITKPMPNLRTLKCPNYPLTGLFSSHDTQRKLNLEIDLKPAKDSLQVEAKPLALHEFMNIATLRMVSDFVIPKKKKNMKNLKNNHSTNIQQPVLFDYTREITLQLDCAIPSQLPDLTTTFSRLRVLILFRFSDNLVDLSELALAGVNKIPILAIAESRELKSLYPPHVTPTHEHLYLDDCPFLGTLGSPSSLRLISMVSIRKCAALKDVRGLHGCQEIRFHKQERVSKEKIKGFVEIVDQLEPFIPLKEIEELMNTFDFDHFHRLHY